MSTSNRYNIIGYGVCGANERYIKATLDQFKALCDKVVIVCNNTDQATRDLILSYGFEIREDNRVWGENQHKIKEDLVKSLEVYKPDWLVCLDMDEVFHNMTRERFESMADQCDAMYVYIVNLWNDGWKRQWSFWNIRAWKWNGITKFVNRPLHCGLAPEWAYHYGSDVPVLLIHSGLKDKDKRDAKIERYKTFDPNAKYRSKGYYDGLADNTCDDLDLEYIERTISKEVGKIKRKKMDSIKPQVFYIVEKNGKETDIPERLLEDHIKRGFKIIKELK